MNMDEAIDLVARFGRNQVNITHQCWEGKQPTNKSAREERQLIKKLLKQLTGGKVRMDHIVLCMNRIG